MSEAVSEAVSGAVAAPEHPAGLTRRELREQERRSVAGLSAAAETLLAAELAEPALATVTVSDSDRLIAAPAVKDAPIADVDRLQTDAAIVTTSVPLPTRAQLRAARNAAAGLSMPTPAPLTPAPSSLTPLSPAEPTRRAARQPDVRQPDATQPALRHSVIPRPDARQPAPLARSSARQPAPKLRRLATSGVTVLAMAFVALMAVSTSLPAEALLSSADVQAAAHIAAQGSQAEPAQTLSLDGGTDTISIQRDGFQSESIAAVAAASGIRLEATFTNDPNGTIQWPFAVGVHIGDRFGYRNCSGCSADHQGQDFNPGIGAPIQAVADGVVSYTEDGEGSLGVHMIIDHMIGGKLVSSVYAHMIHGSMQFKTGDVIKVGQIIGKVGNTGMSTGPHLHFEIRLGGKDGLHVDPLVWLRANAN